MIAMPVGLFMTSSMLEMEKQKVMIIACLDQHILLALSC
jgi:hypothetical protein